MGSLPLGRETRGEDDESSGRAREQARGERILDEEQQLEVGTAQPVYSQVQASGKEEVVCV